MGRFARVVAVDVPHHVTQRGNARQLILDGDTDRAGGPVPIGDKNIPDCPILNLKGAPLLATFARSGSAAK